MPCCHEAIVESASYECYSDEETEPLGLGFPRPIMERMECLPMSGSMQSACLMSQSLYIVRTILFVQYYFLIAIISLVYLEAVLIGNAML